LKNLYLDDKYQKYNIKHIESLKEVFDKKKNIKFIKKKTSKYLKDIYKSLNQMHNVEYSIKDWGILIEHFLLISVIQIKKRFDFLKKVKKNKYQILSLNTNFYFKDTTEYKYDLLMKTDLNFYINYLISKELKQKFYLRKKVSRIKYKSISNSNKFINFLNYILIRLFKPYLIVDGYMGIKNLLKIFFFSKFNFLFVNINFLKKPTPFKKKKLFLRNKIKLSIHDTFDKVFEAYIKNIFPASFIENFKTNLSKNYFIKKDIKKLGTSIHLSVTDEFKFLALDLRKRKKKIFNIQHGGVFGERKFGHEDYINNKYSDLNIYWKNKKLGIGPTYFYEKKIPIDFKNNRVLFFPSQYMFQEQIENLRLNNHIILNQFLSLAKLLNKRDFHKFHIKFFNKNYNSLQKKIWLNELGNRVVFEDKSYKGNIFKNFDIIVIDHISTAFYELMYYKKPFFIICNLNLNEYNDNFLKIISGLKKINILFNDEKMLSKYMNKGHLFMKSEWLKKIKSKEYNLTRKYLFPVEKFDHNKFIKTIKKL
jgi:putative transferase (TIGR04331 family)